MTDEQRRQALRRALDGHWEYVCRVTSDEPFEDAEWGRGGIMNISVSLPWTGVAAKIEAERLWATTSRGDEAAKRKPLLEPVQWHADGGVLFDDGELSFQYFSGEGQGVTKDTFQLLEEDGTLYLGRGNFTHQRGDGQHVKGTVQLRKMRDYNDYKWAPEGINPTGTVVPPSHRMNEATTPRNARTGRGLENKITLNFSKAGVVTIGDISGGEITGTAEQISFAERDSNSLKIVLLKIGIPPEDVDEIKTIVESEQPRERALGSRAAEWVGKMVTKSLTGAWEVGKGVSVKMLSEILLRYYGITP